MSRALVPLLVAIAVLTPNCGLADVDIASPEAGTHFMPYASIPVQGTASSEYYGKTFVVTLCHGEDVHDGELADVSGEGDWSCQFEPPTSGWSPAGDWEIRVTYLGQFKASVSIIINEMQ